MGTLSCFDRILFRGYLPLFSDAVMAAFVDSRGIERPRSFPVSMPMQRKSLHSSVQNAKN